jgi:hypothetical protein
MSSRNEGGEKRPLRVGGCTLQLRQSSSHLYIRSNMPSSNRGWQNEWFYLRNDGGLLPEYTRKMVVECPAKWGWAPNGGSEMPPQPVAPEGLIEPRPAAGAEMEGSTEAPRAETIVRAPVPTAGETGTHQTSLSAPGGGQGAPSSQKSAAP